MPRMLTCMRSQHAERLAKVPACPRYHKPPCFFLRCRLHLHFVTDVRVREQERAWSAARGRTAAPPCPRRERGCCGGRRLAPARPGSRSREPCPGNWRHTSASGPGSKVGREGDGHEMGCRQFTQMYDVAACGSRAQYAGCTAGLYAAVLWLCSVQEEGQEFSSAGDM